MSTMTKSSVFDWAPGKLAMKGSPAKTVEQAVGGRDAQFEPKLDGHRGLVCVGRDDVHFFAGSGVEKGWLIPHIVDEIAGLEIKPGTWIDGEVYTGSGLADGKDWSGTQSILGSKTAVNPRHREAKLAVFDLLAYDNLDLRGLALRDRRAALEEVLAPGEFVTINPVLPATDEEYQRLLEMGFEGGMVKWLDSTYRSGMRGPGWFKVKNAETTNVIVVGFKPGKNGFLGMIGAISFAQFVDGELTPVGSCSGMTIPMRKWFTEHQDEVMGSIIEISHMGAWINEDGERSYRHPQYKRIRDDKLPAECVWKGE